MKLKVLLLLVLGSAASGCVMETRTDRAARPSNGEISQLMQSEITRQSWGKDAAIERLEVASHGALACGFLTASGQPPLVIMYFDRSPSGDDHTIAYGVVTQTADFGLEANHVIANSYLTMCREGGALTGAPPSGWTTPQ